MSTDTPTASQHPAEPRARVPGRDRAWLTSAVLLGLLTFATHGANFAFTFMGARLLAPGDFATLTAMLGIVLVGMAPGMALQALTAAGVLGGPATIDAPIVRRLALVIAGLVAGIMVVLGPALGTWNPVSVVAIGTAAGLLPLSAANEGVLQGRGRFTALGVVLCTGAMVKLAVGVTGMATAATVWAAALGIALGYGAQLALSRRLAGTDGPMTAPRTGPTVGLPGPVVTAVVMMGLLLVVIHVDAVMARLLLDDLSAGLYAVGATAMRIVFWAPQFAVLLLFPVLVTDPRRRVVTAAIGGLVVAGAIGTLAAALAGPTLVPFVFGDEYTAIGPDLWRFAWLGTAAVGLQVLALSDLATGRREALWVLAGTVATIVGVLLATRPTDPVAVITLVASIVTGFVVLGTLRRLAHPSPAGDDGPRAGLP
jgi:hypothetical protein